MTPDNYPLLCLMLFSFFKVMLGFLVCEIGGVITFGKSAQVRFLLKCILVLLRECLQMEFMKLLDPKILQHPLIQC